MSDEKIDELIDLLDNLYNLYNIKNNMNILLELTKSKKGGSKNYEHKHIKYKQKYLLLKNT